MKAAVILSGSGVYDGSEIHEAVFTLLALEEEGHSYQIYAPDKEQFHVVNHLTGDDMNEKRNVLVEAARIARGEISTLTALSVEDADCLIIPGGFGAAKNLNQWALQGPAGEIDKEVKAIVTAFASARKPIVGLCMGPTVIAQALQGSGVNATVTVGSTEAPSPYDIDGINQGMESLGVKSVQKTIDEIQIDTANNIITAPCYMMEASLLQVRQNISSAIKALAELN